LTLIVDSSAWIEFLTAGQHGPRVRSYLESSEALICPDLVVAEVARMLEGQGLAAGTVAGHLRSMMALSTVHSIDLGVALLTGSADRDLRSRARSRRLSLPGFADAVILAFARYYGGTVLTGDSHFEGLAETTWLGA
jgi:predicted nucleic acid-binding protein